MDFYTAPTNVCTAAGMGDMGMDMDLLFRDVDVGLHVTGTWLYRDVD